MSNPMPMLPISQPNAMLYCSGWTIRRVTSAAIGPSVAPKNPVIQNTTNSPGMECIKPQQNMAIAEKKKALDIFIRFCLNIHELCTAVAKSDKGH